MPPPVATTHTHAHTSPCRTPLRTSLVLGLASASALAFLPGGTATAAPQPAAAPPAAAQPSGQPTIAEVQARADALDLQVEQAVEDYREAEFALEGLRAQAAAAQAEVTRQQQAVAALQAQLGGVVAASYRSGTGAGGGLTALTGSRDVRTWLDKVAALEQISSAQSARLTEVNDAKAQLEDTVRQAEAQVVAQQEVEQRAAQRRAQIEADLAASSALLGSLQAQQRAELEAARQAQAAQDAARSAAAERASRDRAPAPSAPAATYTGPATGAAAVAVAEAYAKLGSPYSWGANGPGSFDCSGLTSWVWAKAGVQLPRTSRAQYAAGRKVSQAEVQPGDLLYFGSPISHVGIYVGGGNMIAAPQTGDVVKVSPAFRSNYVGATRP